MSKPDPILVGLYKEIKELRKDVERLKAREMPSSATPGHTHSGADVTSGTVVDARIDAALARDSEVFSIVLANDGTGSLLDSDKLDGVEGAGYSLSGHTHAAGDATTLDGIDSTGFSLAAHAHTHVGTHVTHNANQSINNVTFTVLAFNTERWDTDTFHDTVTNNSRLTIPTGKTGKYIISAGIEWAVNSTGERFIGIRKNGTTMLRIVTQLPTVTADMRMSVSAIVSLAATDYIDVMVWQNSGGALNVAAAGDNSPEFECAYLGA